MINTVGVTLRFGGRVLFEDVNIKFTDGNCYGLIGANGTGKSTFLKILSGEIEPSKGEVIIPEGKRLAVLKQDHFAYDEYTVLDTVIMGHERLYEIMRKKEELYAKPDFNDDDGILLSELEGEFAELNGWDAETDAEKLLNGVGIPSELHYSKMADLEAGLKVKVLLAQALFGNPDILLLDEPTNHLDIKTVRWLEDFLVNFENTVIVVSHDRHFLNAVCTQIADIDYNKIQLYAGNYDFWYESSQIALQMAKDQNKKKEEKIKELQEFIQRFSANASKSKQATSRKRALEKIELDDMRPSSRKYPYIDFKPNREIGDHILSVNNLCYTTPEGEEILKNVSVSLDRGDKVAFVGTNGIQKTTLFKILMGELEPTSGEFKWGITTSQAYLPNDNTEYFNVKDMNLVEWLRQYSKDDSATFLRGWLGRMLFSGDEALKQANVLSGGEKVRCMLAKMMLSGANVLIFDEPTNHLDLESITALNNGMKNFKGTMLFTSHDHQLVDTVASRIIEIKDEGIIDKRMNYEEYLDWLESVQ